MQTVTITTLRGIGRHGYRTGESVHATITRARDIYAPLPLTGDHVRAVMAGWAAERSDLTRAA